MILVTTAGKVGTETARMLAERGADVRVLARRRPDAASQLASSGVQVVQADLEDAAALARALDGVRSVVLVTPALVDQELAVVRAAATAGVEHVVKVTSKASLDSPIARRRDQALIEQGLESSGLSHTLLRNNMFMQNFLLLAPRIAAAGSFGSPTGDGRIGMVDARDVAAVAAEIAYAPAGHESRTYWPTGPATLSYSDVASILSDVVGRPVTHQSLTADQQRDAMIAAGVPAPVAAMNAQALELCAHGDADWTTGDVQLVTGRAPRDFRGFAVENAALFGAQM